MIALVSLVWIASCCTSFAFNKNDYSKEFGYSTRAVQEEFESTASPPAAARGNSDVKQREDNTALRKNAKRMPDEFENRKELLID